MVPGRKQSMPCVYGDTPTFLGVPRITDSKEMTGNDVIFLGVPWEGTITWGSYSGCELSPKTIRHAAARYGGYLPEIDLDFFDYLRVADAGDVTVIPGNEIATMQSVENKTAEIVSAGAIPFLIGGDHSFTPAAIKALGRSIKGKIGVIHFDSHFDNAESFGNDVYPRCSPLHHIANIPNVKKTSIVQIGIRGPRNSKRQMEYARELGVKVLTIQAIRHRGFDAVLDETIAAARDGTKAIYVTICSDIIDAAFNPGGPCDFDGLTPHELFYALRRIGEGGMSGLDFVEIYPLQDPNGFSSHLAAWTFIHALAGIALGKRK
jgi:Arginase/agmatinase/formimionoglutamate hydrolase, arginase family